MKRKKERVDILVMDGSVMDSVVLKTRKWIWFIVHMSVYIDLSMLVASSMALSRKGVKLALTLRDWRFKIGHILSVAHAASQLNGKIHKQKWTCVEEMSHQKVALSYDILLFLRHSSPVRATLINHSNLVISQCFYHFTNTLTLRNRFQYKLGSQ